MSTILLTWNSKRGTWKELEEAAEATSRDEEPEQRWGWWSPGNSITIQPDDQAFLLKQGEEPQGFIASGRVVRAGYAVQHGEAVKNRAGDKLICVDVKFDRILDPNRVPPLSTANLATGPLSKVTWTIPASGTELLAEAAADLEVLWTRHLQGIDGPQYLKANEANKQAQGGKEQDPFVPQDGDGRAVVLRQIRARRGQQAFRDALRERYGDRCMITGCQLMDVVEAAHIKPYRGDADNHPANGLLLRADLHTLFDLDLIGIEPETLTVRVHPDAGAAGYGGFNGVKLKCSSSEPSQDELVLRWKKFQRRIKAVGSS